MTTQTATDLPDPNEYDAHGRPLPDRDRKRMEGQPFKTRIPALHAGTRAMLRGYKPPLGRAYILFEKWNMQILGEAERVLTWSLWPFPIDDRPDQFTKIEHFVRKGYRLLHWGNFYYLTDARKERSLKAQAHNNAWAELEKALEALADNPNVLTENVELKTENAALQQKVREYEERLAQEAAAAAVPPAEPKKGGK